MLRSKSIASLWFCISIFLVVQNAEAEIIYESGSLKGFFAGTCEACAYDNLISHMTEAIALENANHYNPLDPQTTGFGEHVVIPMDVAGFELLSTWKSLFDLLVSHQWEAADAFLEASLDDYPYELVRLQDETAAKTYYILREQLDSAYVDSNDVDNPLDDEIGSFRYSWGVYVFSIDALHPRATIEVVHPNDDYIASHIALDMFETLDAGQLFLSTAGREVAWDSSHTSFYQNNLSLSDPSRNCQHVFNMAHRATTDYYRDIFLDKAFLVQMHSYDTYGRGGYPSAIIALHTDDDYFNLPVYDRSGILGGMVDRTNWFVHPSGVIGNPDPITLTEFYGICSDDPPEVVDEGGTEHELDRIFFLCGYSSNCQMSYGLNSYCNEYDANLHLECDELPRSIEDSTELEFYGGAGFPVNWENFETIVEYYHPMAENLRASLDTIESYVDTVFSLPPENLWVRSVQQGNIMLNWESGFDPNFYSYKVYWDTSPNLSVSSPYIDLDDYFTLCDQGSHSASFNSLQADATYYFAITAKDNFGNESEISDIIWAIPNTTPRILSPTGGELWASEELQSIRWSGTGFSSGVWIELNRDYPEGTWEILAEDVPDDGIEWITLGQPLSNNCRIRVRTEDFSVSVVSQENFSIVSSDGILQVESMDGEIAPFLSWDAGYLECPDSAEMILGFRNIGMTEVSVQEPQFQNGMYFNLENNCQTEFNIPPQSRASCSISLHFSDSNPGFYIDTLLIPTDASNAIDGYVKIPASIERTITISPPEIVLTREGSSIRLRWYPINESVQGCQLNPTYRVWYYEDEWANRYYLGDTTDSTYLHDSVLENKNRLFYEVHVMDAD